MLLQPLLDQCPGHDTQGVEERGIIFIKIGSVTVKCGKYYLSEVRFIKNKHASSGNSIFN